MLSNKDDNDVDQFVELNIEDNQENNEENEINDYNSNKIDTDIDKYNLNENLSSNKKINDKKINQKEEKEKFQFGRNNQINYNKQCKQKVEIKGDFVNKNIDGNNEKNEKNEIINNINIKKENDECKEILSNKNSNENNLKININNNINNIISNKNNNDINIEIEKEEPETEIYNNKEEKNIKINQNNQVQKTNDENSNKNELKKFINDKNIVHSNQKNNKKEINYKQKNELINKEYNDFSNNSKKDIKINNFLPGSNPQTFNFFNILSKPSPIKPPKNISKNKNITNNARSKDKNIFQRLFKEAQYQRIFPKKPCHFRYKKSKDNKQVLTLIEGEMNKKGKKLNLKIGNKTTNNYGEYLYEKDKKYQEEKEKRIVLNKQKKIQEEKNSFIFKPINNYENKLKSNTSKNEISQEEKTSNKYYYYNDDLNKYLYGSNNYRTSNLKYKENMIKNNIDKIENKSINQKYQDNRSSNNNSSNNNKLFYNSNNLKKNKNKIKIPYDKSRINDIHQKLFNSRIKPKLEKNNLFSSKSFSNKSFNINNSCSTMVSEEENRNIFINLFNAINKEQKDYISGNTLNLSKVPKNILLIINPIIQELLNNKDVKIKKEEFISCMNELFNNISSVDKRLIIYTYRNKNSKNNSLVINNNKTNFRQFRIRPETPDFSLKNKYNYYYNNMQKMSLNNLKNSYVDFQSSKTQKKVEEFLYGSNANFYHGF